MTMRTPSSSMSIMRRLLLLLLLICLNCGISDCVDPVECPDGGAWGGDGKRRNNKPRVIQADRVNDDYCDCPITGADEPNTSACAGSMDWPGVVHVPEKKEEDEQDDDKKKEQDEKIIFACPQQPKLKLAASKLNDGICDCCDGADEIDGTTTTCVDDCDVVLAEERRQREKFKKSYEKGHKRRMEELQKYASFRKEQLEKINKLEADLFFVEKQALQTDELYQKAQLQWIHQRLNQVSSRVMAVATSNSVEHPYVGDKKRVAQLKGMLEALSTTELEWLIVHACQMAGEMTEPPEGDEAAAEEPSLAPSLLPSPWDPVRTASKNKQKKNKHNSKNHGGNGKTCIPLRLAGLDAGIMWEPETYKFVHVSNDSSSSSSSSDDENGDDANDRKRELAELLAYNMQTHDDNDDPIVWHAKNLPHNKKDNRGSRSRRNRRRLSVLELDEDWDDYDDDEYEHYPHSDDDVSMLEEDDYENDYHGDDEEEEDDNDADEDDPHRHRRGRGRSSSPDTSSDDDGNANKHAEMKTLIQNQSFSKSRVLFLERSDFLIKKIDQITEQQEDAAANEKNTEEEEQQGEDADAEPAEEGVETAKEEANKEEADPASSSSLSFDPMVLPMTKNQLQKRRDDIERGLNYAVSSRVLLDSLRQAVLGEPEKEKDADEAAVERQKQYLQTLAMMTINHGQLSALQVWQLFQSVIPELSTTTSPDDEAPAEETCQAPWAGSCPPRSIERTASNGVKLSIPPAPIFKLAQTFCDGSLSSDNSSSTTTSSAYRPELACANPAEIPNTVPDGLFGYVSIQPRNDETDLMSHVFEGLSLREESSDLTELKELEQEKERLEKEKNDMNNEIDDLISSIGGKDEDDNGDPKFGPNGELHAIRDSCFSVDAGKYTYELCMFKQANQRDLGQKHGGTNLGKFHGASVDEESGQRVWKWDHGAKCWNGPMRSATAHVTCGEETKVLSADEPDTCRYVFEVESYIACDEDFRVQYGL